jgi:cyclopropane fatty-acyl-phospholipid synthase-like methyltransferase
MVAGSTKMSGRGDKRRVWETYTLPNIWNEIKLRLAGSRKRYDGGHLRPGLAESYDGAHAREVGGFYDAHHGDFLQVYGEVIQAFRTKDVADMLNYQIDSIGLAPGQRVLDAGCGIGVPAIYFARHAQVQVDGITVSQRQYDAAVEKIAATNYADRVTVVHGDYHNLTKYFSAQSYDVVYFLESFGHSKAKPYLLDSCWEILKPGGTLYIKDLFRRISFKPEHKQRIDKEISRINAAYRYDVADLNEVLDNLRGRGFVLTLLKTIDFSLEQFEDLAISNQFQELTGLARIENWEEYVFPVEFFEIKCIKPEFSLDERLDRSFLQQRYHRAMEGQLNQ